jgi:hypothetical protein
MLLMANWIQDYVMDLPLQPNGRMRMDCPVCAKKNTFSVGEQDGQRLYHCFHADCSASGRTGFRLTKDVTTHPMLLKTKKKSLSPFPSSGFEVPETFVSISRSPESVSYLKQVNAYESYLEGRVDLRFDFKRNRIVYMITDGKNQNGGDMENQVILSFAAGDVSVLLLEDCASACSVSSIFRG